MDCSRIREARKALKMTQGELAEIIGVTHATLSRYENGIIDPPSSQLQKIADALNVSVDYLMNGVIEVNSAYIGPGVAVYRNTSPYGIDLSVLEDVPEDSYKIKYQDRHTIITVDKDSPLSDMEITNLVNEIMLAYNLHSSATIEDSLSGEEIALKTLLNSLGYNIIKTSGEYFFTYESGGSRICESDLNELLNCAKNGLKVAAKTLELKLMHKVLASIGRTETTPQSSPAPQGDTDTTPPPAPPERPPEGE